MKSAGRRKRGKEEERLSHGLMIRERREEKKTTAHPFFLRQERGEKKIAGNPVWVKKEKKNGRQARHLILPNWGGKGKKKRGEAERRRRFAIDFLVALRDKRRGGDTMRQI